MIFASLGQGGKNAMQRIDEQLKIAKTLKNELVDLKKKKDQYQVSIKSNSRLLQFKLITTEDFKDEIQDACNNLHGISIKIKEVKIKLKPAIAEIEKILEENKLTIKTELKEILIALNLKMNKPKLVSAYIARYQQLLQSDTLNLKYDDLSVIIKNAARILAKHHLLEELKQMLVVFNEFRQMVGKFNELNYLKEKEALLIKPIETSLLRVAAFHGQYEILDYLFKLNPKIINAAHSKSKQTALHRVMVGRNSTLAKGNEHQAITEYLIFKGADVAAHDANHQTPLDLIEKNDWFLIQVIAWHMKWRIQNHFYAQPHPRYKKPDFLACFNKEYYLGLINHGLVHKDTYYIVGTACKLGLLTAFHYSLDYEIMVSRCFHLLNYGYLASYEYQQEILMYLNQVRNYSNDKLGLMPVPQISFDQFCRERMAKEFILHSHVPPAFDNLPQLYSLTENLKKEDREPFDQYCHGVVEEENPINTALFDLKDMLGIVLTSSTIYFLTDDWFYPLSSFIIAGLLAAGFEPSHQFSASVFMSLLAIEHSQDSAWYTLPIFAASALSGIRLFFSKESKTPTPNDYVAKKHRADHLLMFQSAESPAQIKHHREKREFKK